MTRLDIRKEFCPPKPAIETRTLLASREATELAGLFKVLANDTRLKILYVLARAQELGVTEVAHLVGMKAQAVSNQLQMLAHRGILGYRRDGVHIIYRILDPCVVRLLDYGLCLNEDAKAIKS
jgi:ArsR family transcriptional regulator, lead/cadmium/zinc/bismuth-responsive transcriptional repressor